MSQAEWAFGLPVTETVGAVTNNKKCALMTPNNLALSLAMPASCIIFSAQESPLRTPFI